MWLLLFACGPADPPARWSEVEALADLGPCGPPPADLAQVPEDLDPAELRGRLVAWDRADPAALTRFPSDTLFRLIEPLSAELSDAEAAAVAHLVITAERCGALTDAIVASAFARTLCRPRHAAFAEGIARRLPLPDPRGLAAREALYLAELVAPTAELSPFHRRFANDLLHVLADWVLSDDLAPPPRVLERTRPLVSIGTAATEELWTELAAWRPELERCATVEPSGVRLPDGRFVPADALAPAPAVAAWVAEHPGWHALPAALDGPETRAALAGACASGCAATGRAWIVSPGGLAAPVDELLDLLPLTAGLEPAAEAALRALPAGFHPPPADLGPLWAAGLAEGRVRLLSPEGTVTRFTLRDGAWTTPDGRAVHPATLATVGALWSDGYALSARFPGGAEGPLGPARAWSADGAPSGTLDGLVLARVRCATCPGGERLEARVAGEAPAPGFAGFVVGGRGAIGRAPALAEAVAALDVDEDGVPEALFLEDDAGARLATVAGVAPVDGG